MLILCEKPSVAKEFAHALSCAPNKGFYRSGNLVVTYCVGHLFELCPPEHYNPIYKKWDIQNLPIIPDTFVYQGKPEVKEQTACVITLVKEHITDEIVIATDAGREGELIARLVLQEAGLKDLSRCKRFWVSEALTGDVIKGGLQSAKPLSAYNGIAAQGFARQRSDWLVGMNLTELMTLRSGTMFSVGRVQTAVLSSRAGRHERVCCANSMAGIFPSPAIFPTPAINKGGLRPRSPPSDPSQRPLPLPSEQATYGRSETKNADRFADCAFPRSFLHRQRRCKKQPRCFT
jgi:DNA topoisomerase-3